MDAIKIAFDNHRWGTRGISVVLEVRPRAAIFSLLNRAGILYAVLFLGCAASASSFEGVHAYNSGRDKIAQTALGTYTNLNLLQVTSVASTNLETFHSQELVLQDKLNAILRDLKVFAICTDSKHSVDWSLFTDEITNRFSILFGGSADEAEQLARSKAADSANLKLLLDTLVFKANIFQSKYRVRPDSFSYSNPLPDVPSESLLKGRNTDNAARFDADYRDYQATYNHAYSIATKNLGSGDLNEAYAKMAEGIAEISQLKQAADKLTKPIKDATDQIDGALKAGKDLRIPEVYLAVSNGLAELKKAVDAAAKSGNSFAIVSAVKTNQAAIDETIAAAITASPSTNLSSAAPSTRRAVLIAAQLSPLADAAGKLETALKMPRVSSLLMQQELLSIQLDAANESITMLTRRVDALQRKFQAILLEVQMLQEVRQERVALTNHILQIAELPPDWVRSANSILADQNKKLPDDLLALPTALLLAPSTPEEYKEPVVAAILKLAASIRVARLRQDDADLELIHLDYLSANAANETGMRMWNSLIAIPVNQIATYYGSGFKPTEVADILVKALGLGAIAWRVH